MVDVVDVVGGVDDPEDVELAAPVGFPQPAMFIAAHIITSIKVCFDILTMFF
jgi:hypothetical protein